MRRVAITGTGIVSPIGNSTAVVAHALANNVSGIRQMPQWQDVKGLRSLVAGTVDGTDPKRIHRNYRRTMGRVALFGSLAALDAAASAGLDSDQLQSPRIGVAMGSTTGSVPALEAFFRDYIGHGGIEQQEGTLFMKVMSHTVAANVAALLGVQGRVLAPCSACASSTQAIGAGYEAIREGHQDIMLCGGAEDLHPTTAGVFDILHAASKAFNDRPQCTPRPFDLQRDGLVVGEGGAVVVLEEIEHARARGANVLGEVIGYATNGGGGHMTSPSVESMVHCMRGALASARVEPTGLDYINAHATATNLGDAEEAAALRELVGDAVPVSSTKGHTGHTLAACGAMEVIFCLLMMRDGFLAPTLNLQEVDPQCGGLRHIVRVEKADPVTVMSNNFAFGGIGATLILRKTLYED